MQFAINYSAAAATLVRQGSVHVDMFKCPAWPNVVEEAQRLRPSYVHFPLAVGSGGSDALDTETHQPADWAKVESLLVQTQTPFINLHIVPTIEDYPLIPADTQEPSQCDWLMTQIIRDVHAVVQRFGAERVILENDHPSGGRHLRPAFLPNVIHQVITETGCGFLCDLSHARLAAHHLGMEIDVYMQCLPTASIRELHLTGIQHFDHVWIERLEDADVPSGTIQRLAGRLMDHLPFTEDDWKVNTWCSENIRTRTWAMPWSVCVEYGGVGRLWEAVTDINIIQEQLPRLYAMLFQ